MLQPGSRQSHDPHTAPEEDAYGRWGRAPRCRLTWLTSEPLLKLKPLAPLLALVILHIETQNIKVLRANQKNAVAEAGIQ